ncbi:MAG: MATE family efflux transporter [Oscillospiraceae bacterium]|nr:MATE family efflux transporter [Oscillospiraceae bacterium]
MSQKTTDMTKGPILPQMMRFALPVLLGMLFQRIYNFADVYIVGRYLGDSALAAVSIAGTAMFVIYSIKMGLSAGVGVVISQYYGAGDMKKVKETFVTSIWVLGAAVLIITVGGLLGGRGLLRLLQTSDELIDYAHTYLAVIFAGSAATMLYNWISSVLRSLGNSVVPLIFLIISSVLNVILDIVFVAWIPMGVAGAALATVLAQVISGAACLAYAMKILPMLRFRLRDLKPDRALVREILRYGIPTGLQMSIISVSDMTLQGKINTYSTALVVAYGICMKVEGLGWQLADAIGTAVSTFTGQNVGARNLARVKQGVRCAYLINGICYGVFCPVVWLFAEPIMRAFTSNPEAIAYGVEYMRIFSFFFLIGGTKTIFHGILRASGDVKYTLYMGLSEVVTRIGFTFLFTALFGYKGLWWVSPLTWICAVGVGAIRYYSGRWEKIAEKEFARQDAEHRHDEHDEVEAIG